MIDFNEKYAKAWELAVEMMEVCDIDLLSEQPPDEEVLRIIEGPLKHEMLSQAKLLREDNERLNEFLDKKLNKQEKSNEK